ncbi:protein ORF-A [Proboscivirus elephantidbeta4]|uniref:Protein ORF-A n=1 Tax=Elephant endotheliotropic herpesvirus 4 TaxID=548914 RepID=A0A0S1TPK1_9BETA|nr:protein ORF-A [Elephant endotheliotropic herpesvirus 4]ALM25975.1 protein ORF-A [Elephant endotheliotropic herpesvirus 4]
MMKYRFSSNSVTVWVNACRDGFFFCEAATIAEANGLTDPDKAKFYSYHAQMRNVMCSTMLTPYYSPAGNGGTSAKDGGAHFEPLLEIQLQRCKRYRREEMVYFLASMRAACKTYMDIKGIGVLHNQLINLETYIMSLFEEEKRVFNALCSVEDSQVYAGMGPVNHHAMKLARNTINTFKSRVYRNALNRHLHLDVEFMLPFNMSTVVKANDSKFLLNGVHAIATPANGQQQQQQQEPSPASQEAATGNGAQVVPVASDRSHQNGGTSAKIVYKEQTLLENDPSCAVGGDDAFSVTDPCNGKGLIDNIHAFYNPVTNGLAHVKIKLKTCPPQIISIYLPTSRNTAPMESSSAKWNFPLNLTKRAADDSDVDYGDGDRIQLKKLKTYSKHDNNNNNNNAHEQQQRQQKKQLSPLEALLFGDSGATGGGSVSAAATAVATPTTDRRSPAQTAASPDSSTSTTTSAAGGPNKSPAVAGQTGATSSASSPSSDPQPTTTKENSVPAPAASAPPSKQNAAGAPQIRPPRRITLLSGTPLSDSTNALPPPRPPPAPTAAPLSFPSQTAAATMGVPQHASSPSGARQPCEGGGGSGGFAGTAHHAANVATVRPQPQKPSSLPPPAPAGPGSASALQTPPPQQQPPPLPVLTPSSALLRDHSYTPLQHLLAAAASAQQHQAAAPGAPTPVFPSPPPLQRQQQLPSDAGVTGSAAASSTTDFVADPLLSAISSHTGGGRSSCTETSGAVPSSSSSPPLPNPDDDPIANFLGDPDLQAYLDQLIEDTSPENLVSINNSSIEWLLEGFNDNNSSSSTEPSSTTGADFNLDLDNLEEALLSIQQLNDQYGFCV